MSICIGMQATSNNGDEEYDQLWKDFSAVTEISLSKVVTMTTPLHIVTEGPPITTSCGNCTAVRKLKSKNNCASGSGT